LINEHLNGWQPTADEMQNNTPTALPGRASVRIDVIRELAKGYKLPAHELGLTREAVFEELKQKVRWEMREGVTARTEANVSVPDDKMDSPKNRPAKQLTGSPKVEIGTTLGISPNDRRGWRHERDIGVGGPLVGVEL
jgi:hypothetical protein